MRTYDTYKDSGISWLGQIPSHWELKPGFSLYHVNNEKFDMHSEPTVLSLSYGNIIVKKNKDEGLVPENYSGYQVIKPDYIIIRCTDLQNDKVSLRTGIAKNHGIITGAYLGLIANYGFNAQYLHYFLHDWDITKEIYRHGSGLRQVLSWNDMKRLPILVPPLAEQEAIVEYLDSATAEIDNAIASQQRMVELLQERKQIIINQAVTEGLNPDAPMKDSGIEWIGMIPKHWKIGRMKFTGGFDNGLTYSPDEVVADNKGYLVLRSTNIQNYKLDLNDCVYVNSAPDDLFVKRGDIIICSRNGSAKLVGKCAYVDSDLERTTFGAFMMRYRPNINHKYAFYMFQFSITNYMGLFNTSTINQLTKNIVGVMKSIIPPIPEQKEIVNYIESAVRPIDEAISCCQQKITLLTERKQILINDVVTGKIKI